MAFNMSRVALGFAGGALSGYDTMLKAKMQEEYQQKREEAMYNREKNLMELRAKTEQEWALRPDNPENMRIMQDISTSKTQQEYIGKNYQLNVDQLNQRKLQDERSYALDLRRTAAAEAAASASRSADAVKRQLYSIQLGEAKDPIGTKLAEATKLGESLRKVLADSGDPPEIINRKVTEATVSHLTGQKISSDNKQVEVFNDRYKKNADIVAAIPPEEIPVEWAKMTGGKKSQYPGDNVAKTQMIIGRTSADMSAYNQMIGGSKEGGDNDKPPVSPEFFVNKLASIANDLNKVPPDKRSSEQIETYNTIKKEVGTLPKDQQDAFYTKLEKPSEFKKWLMSTSPGKRLTRARELEEAANRSREEMNRQQKIREGREAFK